MSEQPDLSTLPQRMRDAADTLEQYHRQEGFRIPETVQISAATLRSDAEHVAAKSREAEERVALVGTLAQELLKAQHMYYGPEDLNLSRASKNANFLAAHLIENGWRRVDPE